MSDDATPTGEAGTPAGAGTPPAAPVLKYSEEDMTKAIHERMAQWERSAEAKAKKATEQAEADRLREQQEFKALAEKHEARVKELEPQAAQAERYQAALKAHLDTQRKDLPAHITALLDKLDVAEQLEWIAANRDALTPPAGNGTTTTGVPTTPKPAAPLGREDVVQAKMETLRRTGGYGRF